MNFTMPIVLLFAIALTCAVIGSTYKAYYIKKTLIHESEYYSLNAGLCLICALVLFGLGGFKFEISTYSLLLGIVFGVITMINAIVNSMAIKIGPYGYTTVIASLSTAITAISGAVFWYEELGAFKIVGIILMCACFYLAVDTKKEEGKCTNLKWFILCIIGLFSSASVGLIQKIHQSSFFKMELIPFLITAFAVSGLLSLFIFLFLQIKEKKIGSSPKEQVHSLCRIIILFMTVIIVCGICTASTNAINLYLVGVVDTAVFFPIVNGVPLISSIVVSFLLFKEKLTKKQLLGLVIGLVAIVCLFIK